MGFHQALTEFWDARSGRERAVLLAAGALALAAALYGLLWEPGLKASATLSATLPRLRAQVDDMRQQQKDIALLRKSAGTSSQVADLRALLRASFARSALAKSVHRIEWHSTDRALFAAPALEFDAWLQWIGGVQRELGIRLEACNITALDEPGMARIEATFVAGSTGARAP